MTVTRLSELLHIWGEELDGDEVRELEALRVGDQTEFDRGRGCWYEILAVA